MKITIDGKTADITLENEKSLGDVLEGIGEWLAGSGYSLSGLRVNGEALGADAIAGSFDMALDAIDTLDIETAGLPALMAEALVALRQTIGDYENAPFEGRPRVEQRWTASPAASFLAECVPDLSGFAARTFRGEGPAAAALASLAEERLRELRDPLREWEGLEEAVESTAQRLEDLPLDIQTGKDSRAAETVRIFSAITEKLLRICSLLKLEGFITDTVRVDEMPFGVFIDDFSAALKELLAAYEAKDAVLVGDLAEYELAPRLRSFYAAIKTPAAA
ncbi:MAG: hypothetical protein LBU16_09725 [Treponema sp.]|jgi:hypothetical protein|nr:hypothetical protein [Treponema sp.]